MPVYIVLNYRQLQFKLFGMKTIERYFGLLLLSIVLSSCLMVHVIPIDQMEPGKVNLPEHVRKIAFLSRNFKYDIDTLSQYYNYNFILKKVPVRQNRGVDSIAVTKSFESLRKILLESGRFDEIAVYPFSTITPHIGKDALPLASEFVDKLCNESKTDAIVSLEMLTYFFSENSGNPRLRMPKEADVKIAAIWAVYLPGKEGPVDRFKYSDVVRWNQNGEIRDRAKSNVPGRTDGIGIASDIAVKNYSRRLAPYWSKSERYIVGMGGGTWGKAIALAQKYKWEAAAAVWQSYSDSKNLRARGAAALDIAVAKEMLGDYDQAVKWSNESLELFRGGDLKHIAVDYANLLKTRKIKTEKLNEVIK
jgi:hypothetical protein